jgi:hypothetical protein
VKQTAVCSIIRIVSRSGFLKSALICAAIATLAGCITIEYGADPNTGALDGLVARQSTQAEVLLALGEPRGKGGAEFAAQLGRPRDIWFYEYTKADTKTAHLKLLIVFFENDLYDGYWWFSSLEEFHCKNYVFVTRCPEA